MATASGRRELPDYIRRAWHLQPYNGYLARQNGELYTWTVSSLVEAHLKAHLDHYYQHDLNDVRKISSLSSMSAGKILEMLDISDNVEADIRTIANCINSVTLRQLLKDPRTPYLTLRAFLAVPSIANSARQPVDIDEVVLTHEKFIRSRGEEANRDGKYLVTLEDLARVLGAPSNDPQAPLVITRKDPPKGGFEILDEHRQRTIRIQPNDAAFAEAFERITKGMLRGLDWRNVFVASDMVITTLLHTAGPDRDKSIHDGDVDIYLYGLGPEAANRKVEEIYNIWRSNLPPTNRQHLVVKTHKVIIFQSDYPNRRIQIILKLLNSPTQALLNFDLDACAVGFDGRRVLMLPRCARAIETGYSTFTMDLIFGRSLTDRRATQWIRLFKYADRGFALRILPSYVKSLEENNLEKDLPAAKEVEFEKYPFWQKSRKPQGAEPGLKTLRRIAYLGQNYTQRFYFGATPICICPKRGRLLDECVWKDLYDASMAANNSLQAAVKDRAYPSPLPVILLSDLDSSKTYLNIAGGRREIVGFEQLKRHCEAWRLHTRSMAKLGCFEFSNPAYDPSAYDDTPQYEWEMSFATFVCHDITIFAHDIENHNNSLFRKLVIVICQKLQIPHQGHGYANYLTRRIRHQVYGPDLASVMEKQITVPIIIPYDLELHIRDLCSRYTDSVVPNPTHLIPVHDPTRYDAATALLPSLNSTATDESGNPRYVVITNESMWAGQNRAQDEVAEIYWTLFQWLNKSVHLGFPTGTQSPECLFHVADLLRDRVLPEFIVDDGAADEGSKTAATKSGLPMQEALLFRAWAFCKTRRRFVGNKRTPRAHELFEEEAIEYPFPDELFWNDGDEGEGFDGDGGVARWVEVASSSSSTGGEEDCRAG